MRSGCGGEARRGEFTGAGCLCKYPRWLHSSLTCCPAACLAPPPPHTPPTTITLPALQRDVLGGVDYCKRKVLLVREKVDQLMQLVKARQGGLAQVEALLERMEAQAQAQQQQGPPLK